MNEAIAGVAFSSTVWQTAEQTADQTSWQTDGDRLIDDPRPED